MRRENLEEDEWWPPVLEKVIVYHSNEQMLRLPVEIALFH